MVKAMEEIDILLCWVQTYCRIEGNNLANIGRNTNEPIYYKIYINDLRMKIKKKYNFNIRILSARKG